MKKKWRNGYWNESCQCSLEDPGMCFFHVKTNPCSTADGGTVTKKNASVSAGLGWVQAYFWKERKTDLLAGLGAPVFCLLFHLTAGREAAFPSLIPQVSKRKADHRSCIWKINLHKCSDNSVWRVRWCGSCWTQKHWQDHENRDILGSSWGLNSNFWLLTLPGSRI